MLLCEPALTAVVAETLATPRQAGGLRTPLEHIEVDGVGALLVYRALHASHPSADAISTDVAAANGGGICRP